MEARYILGVDGGGTATAAVVADRAGRECGRGQAGPSNPVTLGPAAAADAVATAVQGAMEAAGVRECGELAAAAFCLAGIATPDDAARMRAALLNAGAPRPGWHDLVRRARLAHDALAALAGGTGRPYGVVVIAGTGSIAYGRARVGRERRAGGWGWIAGDEGSAFDLGRRGLRAAARCADGRGPATSLLRDLLAALRCHSMEEAVRALPVGAELRPAIAALAPVVLRAAESGDAVARDLAMHAARGLAQAAEAVLRGLDLSPAGATVVMHGGLLRGSALMRACLAAELDRRLPGVLAVEPQHDAAVGAALLAMEEL